MGEKAYLVSEVCWDSYTDGAIEWNNECGVHPIALYLSKDQARAVALAENLAKIMECIPSGDAFGDLPHHELNADFFPKLTEQVRHLFGDARGVYDYHYKQYAEWAKFVKYLEQFPSQTTIQIITDLLNVNEESRWPFYRVTTLQIENRVQT